MFWKTVYLSEQFILIVSAVVEFFNFFQYLLEFMDVDIIELLMFAKTCDCGSHLATFPPLSSLHDHLWVILPFISCSCQPHA